ncbi:MAG: Cna B-type domain-containing protein [Ruminococcus sp.]
MKNLKSLTAVLLLLAVVVLFPLNVSAAGTIDLYHSDSLSVNVVYDKKPVSGMKFNAYLISTVDYCGELTVVDSFQKYADKLDIRGKDNKSWKKMAQVLEQDITNNKSLKPDYSAVTDAKGVVKFKNIPMGLYLIIGNNLKRDNYVYSTSSFFAMLPQQDLSNNTWNYSVTVDAKTKRETEKIDFEVIIIWDDKKLENQRPNYVIVDLYKNGVLHDSVTLSHNESWRHVWYGLDAEYKWTIKERAVNGYHTLDIEQDGNTFTVTNVRRINSEPTEPGNPSLPQTGQLWWPVPVMITLGLLFTVIGLIRRRYSRNDK